MGMRHEIPFSPIEAAGFTRLFVDALLSKKIAPLASVQKGGEFTGAGVYAIYYTGDFAPYAKVAEQNRKGRFAQPIYVGKAVPPGPRKGNTLVSSKPLFRRLGEHRGSIEQANNLRAEDFHCRFRLVADAWITVGERLLIRHFQPLWNSVVDGFGLHDPGDRRYTGELSMWDTIHSGRRWASRMPTPNPLSEQAIFDLTAKALRGDTEATLPQDAQEQEADSEQQSR